MLSSGSSVPAAAAAGAPPVALRWPVVCLTVPKSGTHLVMNVLRELVGREHVRDAFVTAEELAAGPLGGAPRAYVGHVAHSWRAHLALRGARLLALYRDPRDVATSLAMAHFKRKVPDDELTGLIAAEGLSLGEVVDLTVLGDAGSERFPGVAELFERHHLRWRGAAEAVLSYEELLAAREEPGAREGVRRKLGAVLGAELDPGVFAGCLARGAEPGRSATFERGRAGAWAECWTARNRATFAAAAPGLLRRLGYEHDPRTGASAPVATSVPVREAAPARAGGDAGVLRAEVEAIKGTMQRLMRSVADVEPLRAVFFPVPAMGLGLLAWSDDTFHTGLGHVQYIDEDFEAWVERRERGEIVASFPPDTLQPVVELVGPRLRAGGAVHFVDVGCQYGAESILVAQQLAEHGGRLKVTALDPGIAGRLTPWNLRLNGVADRVQFLPVGASNRTGVDLLYGEYGHSENCRTVVRVVASETFAYPCEVVRLDDQLFPWLDGHHLFLKVDVQGGEWNALAGAQRLLRQAPVLGVMAKFVPSVVRTFGDPAAFADLVPGTWRLFEAPYYYLVDAKPQWREIERGRFAEYARELDRSAPDAFSLLLFRFDGAT